MEQLITRRKRGTRSTEPTYTQTLRRSKEARDHLQDLLERSDQKAGFVVTGIAFLGIFLEQGNFDGHATLAALICYGLAFICVCITAFPRKWGWYRGRTVEELLEDHEQESYEAETLESCQQEADLRAIYRSKNLFLMLGFVLMISGMVATLVAVLMKYKL